MAEERPRIAITIGDPLGIGPEVVVKALADGVLAGGARLTIYGSEWALRAAAEAASIEPFWVAGGCVGLVELDERDEAVLCSGSERVAGPTRESGEASFRLVERAIEDARRCENDSARVDAIVTGPISKAAWSLAGHGAYPGHTELLAERFGASRVRMMFVAPSLRVMLVTTHVPLARVASLLTIERIVETIELGHESCARLGIQRPRVAVCGVNPHAGEAGLLGEEDLRVIGPAIEAARRRGIDASGPWPGDTVFGSAVKGRYDLVVAMYHDQGLIPVKLLAFDRAVNYSAGLPVVRTSPDHGTAYDIAGKNLADAGSMRAAVELAMRLTATRRV